MDQRRFHVQKYFYCSNISTFKIIPLMNAISLASLWRNCEVLATKALPVGIPLNTVFLVRIKRLRFLLLSKELLGVFGGHVIEVDSDTLREVSFAKGRLLIATENPNRIEGEVQFIVNGRRYNVRVVEEETFSTVITTHQVSNPEAEEEDDEVDKIDGNRNASSKKNGDLMDDTEKQKTNYSDDMAKRGDEEAEKGDNNVINGSHQSAVLGNIEDGEGFNEESTNSVHGLDSIVQDSQSPLFDDGHDSISNRFQVQNINAQKGINLHVDLNPSAIRRSIRSQQFEASLTTEEEDIDGYIIDSQVQEHNAMDKELQYNITAGNTLGIKYNDSGVLRLKKGCGAVWGNNTNRMKRSMKVFKELINREVYFGVMGLTTTYLIELLLSVGSCISRVEGFLLVSGANSLIMCFLVSRIEASSSDQQQFFMQLDVNTDIYKLHVGDKFNMVLAATLNLDGTPDIGYFTQPQVI
ncbi:hypothetical protein RHSIM_Rhsim09G0077300 [Rhododendron simsii]|uniref:Uncharacterized protein n=1 Tax=Rhododendron simsii TaxID=118357 RepID=A0A834LFY6_RHOSS|nr:hypothetical protein RHSIM_Rhsim09G0077300 [Rhododendron simsii]